MTDHWVQRAGAELSADGVYRWLLWRNIDMPTEPEAERIWLNTPGKSRMLYVMLNPSTADGTVDDPTIRRCRGFATREGFDAFDVVNLFSYRSTDWKKLNDLSLSSSTVIGNETFDWWNRAMDDASIVVAAWGSHVDHLRVDLKHQASTFIDHAKRRGVTLLCLGTTKYGQPSHPLMLNKNQPLERLHR